MHQWVPAVIDDGDDALALAHKKERRKERKKALGQIERQLLNNHLSSFFWGSLLEWMDKHEEVQSNDGDHKERKAFDSLRIHLTIRKCNENYYFGHWDQNWNKDQIAARNSRKNKLQSLGSFWVHFWKLSTSLSSSSLGKEVALQDYLLYC